MKQNLTLSLDKDLIKKAKVLAAHHDTSITGLVAGYIEKMVSEEGGYEASREKALKALEKGYRLGGKRVPRESLYDR